MTTAVRICDEQDCPQPTNRLHQPLCYNHYLELVDGMISLCSDCQVTYKPAEYPVCRSCYQRQRGGIRQSSIRESGGSWDTAFQVQNPTPPPEVVEVVETTVRRNIQQHRDLCTNHETNTIQYLVMPLLQGLGWDIFDPAQVVREYAPTGKRWYGNNSRVDVALFVDREPIVFIEAKRLDRGYDQQYMDQLKDYASHMDSGFAVLTNGQYWLISYVTSGIPQPLGIVNIMDGSVKEAAGELNEFIGKAMVSARRLAPTRASMQSARSPTTEQITDDLKNYRNREAQRRRRPPFTIFNDETIVLIAERKPANTAELQSIKGVGSTTLKQHGAAILEIVAGRIE